MMRVIYIFIFILLASPLYSKERTTIVCATEWGACADDGEDDTEAINKAIEFISKKGDKTLTLSLPKGVYNISQREGESNHIFSIKGRSNFTIDGNGSTLLIETPTVGFMSLEACHNAKICNINIDYKTLPFAQGEIIAVDKEAKTYDFLQDNIAGDLSGANFKSSVTRWATPFTTSPTHKVIDKAPNLIPYYGSELIGKRDDKKIYKVSTSNHIINSIQPGWKLAIIARFNGRSTFMLKDCSDLTFENNNLYAGPAGGCNMRNCDNISIFRCNVLRKDGRLISQNADCIHILPAKRGPHIEGCIFEGQMDDAINMKSELIRIVSKDSHNRYEITGKVDVGDTLALFNPREGELLGYTKVLAVNDDHITIDKEFHDLTLGKTKECDMFFNMNRRNSGFAIKNNIFRGSRRYAMLIQSANGEISGNTMENLSTGAITLENNAYWPEGFIPENIDVRDNSIYNCGFDISYWREHKHCAPIIIRTITYKRAAAKWQGGRDIRLVDNTIHTNSNKAIFLQSVKDIKLRNNTIDGGDNNPIYIENCSNILK